MASAERNGGLLKTLVGEPKRKSNTQHTMKRVSRACLHCRQRKSRCDLDSSGNPGSPPCQRCIRDSRDCVLGSSNRGGRRIRKKPLEVKVDSAAAAAAATATAPTATTATTATTSTSSTTTNTTAAAAPFTTTSNAPHAVAVSRTKSLHLNAAAIPITAGPHPFPPQYPLHPSMTSESPTVDSIHMKDDDDDDDDDLVPIAESSFSHGVLQNPSDAWQCLTNVAQDDDGSFYKSTSPYNSESRRSIQGNGPDNGMAHAQDSPPSIESYRLVKNGSMTGDQVWDLVVHYAENFHPYLPLVPRKFFDRKNLGHFAKEERHLLTAILTIASKNRIQEPHIHEVCSGYMHELISGVAAGAPCEVEAVEALLLIAEWEPPGLQPRIKTIGRGEENRAAWMHVGLALRSGYFLGLERTSFRTDSGGDLQAIHRRRLAWASCYVSDRLISVRIGRAFWSRGPGPMTGLVSDDFPSLQPLTAGDEDYSKIFQATLDLTQLYGNVHDVLYSGMRTSSQMMLMGDYVKYVDDFRIAIDRWHDRWGNISCSPEIKVTLQMQSVYLSLYTNAFAFQAAISQTLSSKPKCTARMQREYLRATFSDVASMQDSRFIYSSVRSAKEYLRILNTSVNPERHLRYLPLRYYLYGTYAAVFLYKAHSFGVISRGEQFEIREMIRETMNRLRRASAGPDKTGTRYALLLERLWFKQSLSTPDLGPRRNTDMSIRASTNGSTETTATQVSPTNDFSWLDLEAVGDFVLGNPIAGGNIIDLSAYVHDPHAAYTNGTPCPIWSVDPNGNLLF
ncbi:hypothetical protein D8B26_002774 [Coccidioides posadasii str. Silveira]|uniref:uncharacterized protein n=1 Tax=Coccidioides posadasii (strain RMSCC 757 / Silveira) TaxID=443226 RepID=UPI001BEF9816|nr:hypothetical protein D8B26_002774 [Coccidioides posadasii str. Silveira]